jgi:hypothetical protein
MIIELEVYSQEQWRDCRKGCYIVRGTVPQLRAFCERWIARDRARDVTGMTIYHNFYIDPNNNLSREQVDELGDELVEFDRFLHPAEYETCPHGLSAWLCADPVNHYDPRY